jgi:predicted NBD/HSP70 family sugar kinase
MTRRKKGTRALKQDSRAKIVLCLRSRGPLPKSEISRATGLGLTCVCDTCKELLSEGVLVEAGTVTAARGRPTVLLTINPNGAPVAGVRIAPECIEIAVATPTLEVLARRIISHDSIPHDDVEAAVAAIAAGIKRCAEAADSDVRLLAGVGVSVHGLVDPVLGVIEEKTNVTGWEDVPIARLLEERLGIPVVADNCVRAAAIAHQWFGADAREGSTLYMAIAEGCGAALVHDREMVRGLHHSGNQVGHMVIDPAGPVCTCGKRGCLEAFASSLGFVRALWPEISRKATEMAPQECDGLVRRGFDLLRSGDPRAKKAYDSVVEHLGVGLSNAIALFGPQTVIIAGVFVDLSPSKFIDDVRRAVLQHLTDRQKGIEIRAVTNISEFLLRGSVGLVMCHPFRALREDSASETGWDALGSSTAGLRPRGVGSGV